MFFVLSGGVLRFWLSCACLGWLTALSRVRACLVLVGLVVGYKLAIRCGSCCACPACSPGAWHLRACPVQRLSPLPGTPILGSLLRECFGLQPCSSWQPTWQTLELRGKRGLESGAQLSVVLSCLGWDAEVVEVCGFPARFVFMLQVGCSCCCVVCVANVVTRCVRAVVARLAVDSLAVVFPMWRTVVGKSRCSMCRVALLVERCDTCLWLLVGLVLAGCELWVRGGSAYGPSTLWRSEVAVLVVRHRSHLVIAWSRWLCRGLLPLGAQLRWFLRESCVCVTTLVGGRGVALFCSAAL
ncbi:hypothetical protein Taro_031088 [Colocasia esculenta]|uniref:Uncharacterized protein n=1 Tax=Colocasia esculenta TaxID=4460 RepID=A0A843VP46_COLES|nr:hypothetical protein [Colocasia esculenta]